MSNFVGHDIGRYNITEKLGEGGMATVYKARDQRLEREVAIKFIRREAVGQELWEEIHLRFEREAKSLAKLSHPNIIQVYDYGEHDGTPYIVMTYISGGTLKALINEPMRYAEAARLLVPIARALDYAHNEGIIHRDIKPANILMTRSGEPMLSDFGIARMLGMEGKTLTGIGTSIGTPEYMSPEQGLGYIVDHRTDIYALGVVFYELVTGTRPYVADTPQLLLVKQVTQPLPRPTLYIPGLPAQVEKVIMKALEKEPAQRYATAREMADALHELIPGGSETAQSQSNSPVKMLMKSAEHMVEQHNLEGAFQLYHQALQGADETDVEEIFRQVKLLEAKLFPPEAFDSNLGNLETLTRIPSADQAGSPSSESTAQKVIQQKTILQQFFTWLKRR